MVLLVVAAVTNSKVAKQNMLLDHLLASKKIFKKERQAWKEGSHITKLVETSWAKNLAFSVRLQALQRVYVEGNDVLFRQEYDTYEVVKAEVEQNYAKIKQPLHYTTLMEKGLSRDYNPSTMCDIKGILHNKYFYEYVADEEDDEGKVISWKTEKHKFVGPWLADENLLTASQLDFKPSLPSGVGADGTFNTWTGYDAERIPAVPDDVAKQLYGLYTKHCLDVLGDSPAKYMLDHLAHILQKPQVRTGVAVLLTGSHGCGKGTIVDVFRGIIGPAHSFCTAKAKEHLFVRFSKGLKKTILVQVDSSPPSQWPVKLCSTKTHYVFCLQFSSF